MGKRIPPALSQAQEGRTTGARWQLGTFELDESRRELRRGERVMVIEPKPLNLLMLLVRHPGELISKGELIERLWGNRPVSDTVIARCVAKLRAALGEHQDWVRTVHGYGYRFDGWVEPLTETLPATTPTPPPTPAPLPGRPGWTLRQRLGRSGETWLAEHNGTGERRVFKLAQDAARLASLKREAVVYRLLAAHPDSGVNLVQLLDWNFHASPYFLELAYCPAGNLADWLGRQPERLSVAQCLQLVAGLAEQLSALHALRVLHKDLKPDNILVVDESPPQLPRLALADLGSGGVIDFERLRALGITRMGQTAAALVGPGESSGGTPLYLAPEVIAGRPWTRQSDIYALGVMLYQLLVGNLRRPLAPGWERDIEDALLREDIAAACDQSPAHRLSDARQLMVRLQSLEARRARRQAEQEAAQEAATLRITLARSRQRRRLQWAVSAALLLGLGISTGLYLEASKARARAEVASATARAVSQFLDDSVLGAADPYRAGGGRNVTIASVLDKAAADFETLASQPALQLRLGLTLVTAYHNLGLEPQARDLGRLALAAAATGGIATDDADLNSLRDQLAWVEINLAETREARALFQQVLNHSDSADRHRRAAYGLARVRFEEGYFAESAAGYRALLDSAAQEGADAWFLADVRWDLAEAEFELHDWAEAAEHLAAVRTLYEQQLPSSDPRLLWLNVSEAYRLQMLEQYPAAEAKLQATLALATAALGERHPVVMASLHLQGIIRNKQGRANEALPLIENVVAWRTQHYGEAHYLTRMSISRLGESYLQLGRKREAEALLRRSWTLSIPALGADHPHTLDNQRLHAESLLALGRSNEAEQQFREVLKLGTQRMPASNNRLAWARYGLARALLARGERAESQTLLAEAAANFRSNYQAPHSLLPAIEALRDSQALNELPQRVSDARAPSAGAAALRSPAFDLPAGG